MPNTKLQMILNKPEGQELLKHVDQSKSAQTRLVKKMNLAEAESKVGFRLKQIKLPNAVFVDAFWLEGFQSYYGKFSDGIRATYRLADKKDAMIMIEQHKIMTSDIPEVFSYPNTIKAYQKEIGNGLTTIVLFPHEWAIPFAQWVADDVMIRLFFSWTVDESTVETVLGSQISQLAAEQ